MENFVMRSMSVMRTRLVYLFVAVGAAAIVMLAMFGHRVPAVTAQISDQFLSRRVDQVEQRFYSLESRLSRLEQQQTRPAVNPPVFNTNETEIGLLRSQVESLRLRVGEAECALLKLDERTLTPDAKRVRARAQAAGTDVCRQDAGSAIKLSARP